jgi:asparagine synthase (glutamine-hydrolysing)
MPGLIKIPNSNTGAPLDAGRIRLYFTDKFHSIMKKLSITGFRHYTEFQKWHREGFRKSSHEIIFSDKTAARG